MTDFLTTLKRIVRGRYLVPALFLAILLTPHFAAASIVQGANAGTDSHSVDFARYGTVCFDVPTTVTVRSFSVGMTRTGQPGSVAGVSKLVNRDTATTVWNVNFTNDNVTGFGTYTSVSTSTTSFTLTPAEYCIFLGSNSGSENFIGASADGGVYSQAYGPTLGENIANSPGTAVAYFGSANYSLCDAFEVCPIATIAAGEGTHIISLSPADGATVSTPTTFTLQAYIAPEDLGDVIGVRIRLHNIDQNFLFQYLPGGDLLSPSDIWFLNDQATTTGIFNFSTTTPIADGNYRIEAELIRSYFGFFPGGTLGWLNNQFSRVHDKVSHQFIVNEGTVIGTISQTVFSEYNAFLSGTTTATTTAAFAGSCNPLGSFDIQECLTYLFVPSGEQTNQAINSFREGVLVKAPWGYFTRIGQIMSATTTTALPSYTVHLFAYADPDATFTVNPGDILAGATAALDSIEDPINGKNWRDVFEPIIQLLVAAIVVVIIFYDIVHGTYQARHGGKGRNGRDA